MPKSRVVGQARSAEAPSAPFGPRPKARGQAQRLSAPRPTLQKMRGRKASKRGGSRRPTSASAHWHTDADTPQCCGSLLRDSEATAGRLPQRELAAARPNKSTAHALQLSGGPHRPAAAKPDLGRRFAAALLPRLFGTNPRSHHKGATGRVRTGDQRLPRFNHLLQVLYTCRTVTRSPHQALPAVAHANNPPTQSARKSGGSRRLARINHWHAQPCSSACANLNKPPAHAALLRRSPLRPREKTRCRPQLLRAAASASKSTARWPGVGWAPGRGRGVEGWRGAREG